MYKRGRENDRDEVQGIINLLEKQKRNKLRKKRILERIDRRVSILPIFGQVLSKIPTAMRTSPITITK